MLEFLSQDHSFWSINFGILKFNSAITANLRNESKLRKTLKNELDTPFIILKDLVNAAIL